MGAEQSTINDSNGIKEGFHVFAIDNDSPCLKAGIDIYFDFIVKIDGQICSTNSEISNYLNSCTRDKINLTLYNHVKNHWREVEIPLIKKCGSTFLGIMIVRRAFSEASNRVWHVIDVTPNSPAAKAGINAESDYILGAFKNDHFIDTNDLFLLFEQSIEEKLSLIIYNTHSRSVRLCGLIPSRNWSSTSVVGLNLGCGVLHQIPEPINKPSNNIAGSAVNSAHPTIKYGGLIKKAISEKDLNILITNDKLQESNE